MTKQALVFLSDGCEETEAVTTIDLLTRAAINVTTASISSSREIACSRGVTILAQKVFSDIQYIDFDVVVLPGGLKGAENFRDCPLLIEKLKQTHLNGGIVAAICASPAMVLQHHNLFPNANMTGYPTTKDAFKNWKADRVYFDKSNNVITSQGPATSIDFALKIIDVLLGRTKAAEVAEQLVLPLGIESYQ
ncbi:MULTISPECIES: protein deglycase YajL [unclassified Gilliamella]|jgi:protein deglycase|uniref:protein deglycase YajL n=1 Tax=unclassified Gilliamella TaxID=2685620 RepID=UPI00080E8A5F|nr:protein deglycase YajL [Gilliamella apicola]OCG17950.1 oxidative-stress-resistance chaperone [Gilliamella apicola]OCG59991.1 oxidative-stress-resistance chaperone [Gilliamella apicola]OCG69064.1 oxidative-stress-resistance chaperone [Gilliamella apicola]